MFKKGKTKISKIAKELFIALLLLNVISLIIMLLAKDVVILKTSFFVCSAFTVLISYICCKCIYETDEDDKKDFNYITKS